MVDALDLKSGGLAPVRVQVSPSALVDVAELADAACR